VGNSLVLILIVLGVLWALWELHRHRFKVCPKCKGSGRVYSSWFSRRYMACPRCARKGEVRGVFGSPD